MNDELFAQMLALAAQLVELNAISQAIAYDSADGDNDTYTKTNEQFEQLIAVLSVQFAACDAMG